MRDQDPVFVFDDSGPLPLGIRGQNLWRPESCRSISKGSLAGLLVSG